MNALFRTPAPLTSFEAADVIVDYHINASETDSLHFAVSFAGSVRPEDRAETIKLLKAHGCIESNDKWRKPRDLDLNLTFVRILEYARLRVFQMNSWAELDEPKSQNFAERLGAAACQ